MIYRGQIYWVNLDPTIGAEIKKTRPCLVVSNNQANHFSPLVTVIPITSSVAKIYPFEVFVVSGTGGLKKDGIVKVNQIKTIDKLRLSTKPLGQMLPGSVMNQVDDAIKIHLSIQ